VVFLAAAVAIIPLVTFVWDLGDFNRMAEGAMLGARDVVVMAILQSFVFLIVMWFFMFFWDRCPWSALFSVWETGRVKALSPARTRLHLRGGYLAGFRLLGSVRIPMFFLNVSGSISQSDKGRHEKSPGMRS
jgi:uncharacterized membrane protein